MGKKTQFFIKIFMILLGSVIMAVNINTLTNSGGLLPGGFTGVTLLLQEIILNKFGVKIPFSTFIWIMNIVPAEVTREDAVQAFADNIRQRLVQANLPVRLKDLSLSVEQLALIAEDASNLDIMNQLPRSMTADDLFDLLKLAY